MFIARVSSSSAVHRPARPGGQRAGDGDGHRRRTGDAGAHGRIGPRMDVDAARAEVTRTSRATRGSRSTSSSSGSAASICSSVSSDTSRTAWSRRERQPAVRAQADRRVDRLRAVVKEVERPDVVRAAGEIDPRRRRGVDVHPRIIMAARMSLRDLRRQAGRFVIAGIRRPHRCPTTSAGSSPSSISPASSIFARNIVRASCRSRSCRREVAALAREWPLWISVDQEGGRVARLKRAVHEVAAGDHAGPRAATRRAGGAICDGAGRRAARRRHQSRLRARARRAFESGQSR